MHNATLRRVRESLLPWKTGNYYISVYVHARARVRAGTRARGSVHARKCM
jgi:hypothetical protein